MSDIEAPKPGEKEAAPNTASTSAVTSTKASQNSPVSKTSTSVSSTLDKGCSSSDSSSEDELSSALREARLRSSSTSSSEDELAKSVAKISIEDEKKTITTSAQLATTSMKVSPTRQLLTSVLNRENIKKLADYIRSDDCKNVIFMTGAGISTSAGIPDFRSPKTGLFAQLQNYNLPFPEAIFDIDFFQNNPKPFFHLARELFPGNFRSTPGHFFMKLMNEKGKLLRVYTQNIDGLERLAGLPDEKLIEAHGSFHTGHCIKRSCRKSYTLEWMKERIFDKSKEDNVLRCDNCKSLVKPDIIFYGEDLPKNFAIMSKRDFPRCDLLIVMGTSLAVFPFAGLVELVRSDCRRLLINKESVNGFAASERKNNSRDHFIAGAADEACATLAEMCGWLSDFNSLVAPVSFAKA